MPLCTVYHMLLDNIFKMLCSVNVVRTMREPKIAYRHLLKRVQYRRQGRKRFVEVLLSLRH